MRIVHLVHGYFPECEGGTESYVRSLTAAQVAAGHDVTILAGSFVPWDEVGFEEGEFDGVRVVRLHRTDYFYDYHAKHYHPGVERVLTEWLGKHAPDVVHVHQWLRLTSNLVEICDAVGIPAVVTTHDLYTSCPRAHRVRPDGEACFRKLSVESCLDCVPRYPHEEDPLAAAGIEQFAAEYRAELWRARRILVATSATAEVLVANTGVPASRFTQLALGYSRRFDGLPRPGAWRDGEPIRLGFWGMISKRKGVHVLLEALRDVCEGSAPPGRPIELHVFGRMGTDALDAELRGMADGLPVTFHGRYEYEQLASAGLHLAVFPAACFETFGFVLDEAVELGLPVLVSDIGALPERAGPGAVATPPPSDATALADAIRGVLEDPSRLEAARRHLPKLPPTPAAHATRVERVYRDAIGTARRPAPDVSPIRRAEYLLRQRESAQRALGTEPGPA